MNKLPRCKICGRIIRKQQEWKSDEEKELCLTCKSFLNYCNDMANALELLAKSKGINRCIKIGILKYIEKTPEQKFINAIKKTKHLLTDKLFIN
jgi:hypothetical protein